MASDKGDWHFNIRLPAESRKIYYKLIAYQEIPTGYVAHMTKEYIVSLLHNKELERLERMNPGRTKRELTNPIHKLSKDQVSPSANPEKISAPEPTLSSGDIGPSEKSKNISSEENEMLAAV